MQDSVATQPPTHEPPRRAVSHKLRAVIIVGALIALLALAIGWTLGPVASALNPAALARDAALLRGWALAPLAILLIFVLANAIAAPVTPMIATTVLLFGALRGSLYAYLGMLMSASACYAVSRLAARGMVEAWLARRTNPRLAAINGQVARRGLLAAALLRLTPIPFTLQNVFLGASRIGYFDFLFGTMLGIVPVIVLMAGLAAEFEAWLAHPDARHLAILAAVVLAAIAFGWIRRRIARRP